MSILKRIKQFFSHSTSLDPQVEAYLNQSTDHADLDRRMYDVNRYLNNNSLYISKLGH